MADNLSSTVSQPVETQSTVPNQEEKKETTTASDAPVQSEPTANTEEPETNTEAENKHVSDEPPSTTGGAGKDVEMKDVAETGASAEAVAETAPETVTESTVDAPATPATGKKSNGSTSSKKKSSGVPEHKSKKLNKKKSKAEIRLNCQPGELYLARMKGHAPWPSIICDEEILPASLLNSRPVTTALPDGTFKRADYGPGGKRESERTYPVMFLYTNEFAWLPNTDLTPITPEECASIEEKGKSKALIGAYSVAAEDHDLQHFKTMLAEHQAAIQEDIDRLAEIEAEKAAAKAAKAEKKNRRKSTATVKDDDGDEMEVDDEGESAKSKSKKRKKAADAEEETEEKPAKAPKLKLNGPKTPSTEKKAPAKPKSSTKKATAKKESDEEMEDAPAVEATPLSAAEIKEKKEKDIRLCRHRLQRGLLARDDPPSEKEVEDASGYLSKLEAHPDLEGDIIRNTKIHKVLRAMIRLPSIPMDEVFNLKKRSNELLQKWNATLVNDAGVETGHESGAGAGTTKFTSVEDKKDDSAEKQVEPVAEKKDEPKPVEKQQEEVKTTESENKVNGITTAPPEPAKPVETAVEPPKDVVAEKTNGVEKPAETAAQSEAPKSEDKPVEAAS